MLSGEEARHLERLALGTSSASPAVTAAGLRHARARGQGLEFQDFRHYQPGDDPRTIDWTVDARLRQLVVRVYRAEGHVRLHVLIDTSASMTLGVPTKLACAAKIAAAFAYVAIERRDAVGVSTFDETVRESLAPTAGRPQLFKVLEILRRAEGQGRSDLRGALMDYGRAVRGPGLVLVCSDFFQSDAHLDGLRFLLHRGLTPAVVQVVAADEVDPDIAAEIELADIEDPAAPVVVVDRAAVDEYRRRLGRVSADLEAFCRERGLPWMRVVSNTPFSGIVTGCVDAGLFTTHG